MSLSLRARLKGKKNETREEAICRLHIAGFSPHDIRKLTRIRYQKIVEVIKYYEINSSVPPPAQRGRPPIVTNDIITKIACLTVQNRATPFWRISELLKEEGILHVSRGLA